MVGEDERFLGYFTGPQAETWAVLRDLSALVLADHEHWRHNYFPGDKPMLAPADRSSLSEEHDELENRVRDLLARLRRSFPFHSPRYLGHMQSELSMPAILGVLAGLLYNANNVTSESGNVTMDLELRAASKLLRMLGYREPPVLADGADSEEVERYTAEWDKPYGWCHLTSGGTSANTEALWVARNVTFQVLAIAAACRSRGYDLRVTLGSGDARNIADLSQWELLNLPPDQAVALLPRYLEQDREGQAAALAMLRDPRLGWDPNRSDVPRDGEPQEVSLVHLPRLLAWHRPVVFVPGTAHYSIRKAVDVLGLGGEAVVQIATDSRHRLDMDDLRAKLEDARGRNRVPLAVVGIAGTTEEGAIDPLHDILELRAEVEHDHNVSFWVHADGAWGGYLPAMLRRSPRDDALLLARHLTGLVQPAGRGRPTVTELVEPLEDLTERWIGDFLHALARAPQRATVDELREFEVLQGHRAAGRWDSIVAQLRHLAEEHDLLSSDQQDASLDDVVPRDLRFKQVNAYLEESIELSSARPGGHEVHRPAPREIGVMSQHVFDALTALQDVDSVTVDPHKLGYQPYACGGIAFKDSRVRYSIAQDAPYITELGGGQNKRFQHRPLQYTVVEGQGEARRLVHRTEAAARYTLEGSRPSAPATGLWLSSEVLPLHQDGHGSVLRATWRAAQALACWLDTWEEIEKTLYGTPDFTFKRLAMEPDGSSLMPEGCVVIFGVMPTWSSSLADYNTLTGDVEAAYRISAERGQHDYSYSQPFFLSKTDFAEPAYPASSIRPIAAHIGIDDFEAGYKSRPMTVLRAAVMNPYLTPLRRTERADVLREFMEAMAAVARRAAAQRLRG